MDDDRAILHLEVKAVVLRPESIEQPPVAINFPESVTLQIVEIFLSHLEFLQQFKLFERLQLGELGSADFVKNNLKHSRRLATGRGIASAKMADGEERF